MAMGITGRVMQWVGVESSSFVRGGRAGCERVLTGTEGRPYRSVPTAAPGSYQNICNTVGTSPHSASSTTRVPGAEDPRRPRMTANWVSQHN